MQVFFHPDQMKHDPQTYFSRGMMRKPSEVPERMANLLAAVRKLGYPIVEPQDHGDEIIAAVHSRDYLDFLRDAHAEWKQVPADWGDEVLSNIFVRCPGKPRSILAKAAHYIADGSAPIGAGTYQAVYWSAQSALAGAKALLEGESEAYALCRPPGHHARKEGAGGHCYLNNAAIAAQSLRSRVDRIAILDPDMHHGQGIQELFYDRDDVLYVSMHGDPVNFYPAVAGFEDERGSGPGLGFNLNLPMPHGTSEEQFFGYLARALQAVQDFRPDALILTLGFDIFHEDPHAVAAVTVEGFGKLGAAIGALNLPVLIVQEGGYHLDSLDANARAFFASFDAARRAVTAPA